MNSDNSSCFGDCPKAKKSKTSRESILVPTWVNLPSVVIHEIFDLLNKRDRQNASAVCKNWRQNAFHPKWWPKVTFKIESCNTRRAKFFTSVFARSVSVATIKVNTLLPECAMEFTALIEALSGNNNLKELFIEPSHCRFDISTPYSNFRFNAEHVISTLTRCVRNLSKFSIGYIEDLAEGLEDYLVVLAKHQPQKVIVLGLASVKDDLNGYDDNIFQCELIDHFRNLEVLSIDFDQLSDNFLKCLDGAKNLQRLVVLLHSIREGHPGTTNVAWRDFTNKHPSCELRLTVIHCSQEIRYLHEDILRAQMPLTHLKVFFCENINMAVLEYLSRYYTNTLRSIMWIDSLSVSKESWAFFTSQYENSPDPLIMISWLCKHLDELVLYGYKYCEENLIAIARLRGDKLTKLEIAEDDIFPAANDYSSSQNFMIDIPLHLKQQWTPTKTVDLHPVIRNPTSGDSDEFLLPLVLADLH